MLIFRVIIRCTRELIEVYIKLEVHKNHLRCLYNECQFQDPILIDSDSVARGRDKQSAILTNTKEKI